jgi:hypothetical protein
MEGCDVMTEKMLALKALFDHGDCTLGQVAEVLEIPEGRAFAVLAALVRDGSAVKERQGDGVRYLPTEAGAEKVRAWLLVVRFPRLRMARSV